LTLRRLWLLRTEWTGPVEANQPTRSIMSESVTSG